MRLLFLFVSSLILAIEVHSQSVAGSEEEWQSSEFQLESRFSDQRYAQQSDSKNHPQTGAAARDPNCPGKDNHALMCRLVNAYRAEHGLKPVRLDDAVTREAQYWSGQLNAQSACWFLYHDDNYHTRMRARFPGRRFRENAACSGSTGGGAQFILQKWIDSPGHRQNMLTPEWKTIGVGVTNNIWVIDFTN
jgi:uncharacterized protein YkwD